MMEKYNVQLVVADKSNDRPDIDADLKRFGRANLPVNIIVPKDPNQPCIVMPEIISPKKAIKAILLAAGETVE